MKNKFEKEKAIENYLRKHTWMIYLATILVGGALYFGIYWSMTLFDDGNYWSLFLSGLFAHAFFVITMHDGAHRAITKTKWDSVIMNFSSGLIILPFYTEMFKKYHLLHHAYTNTEQDPLWTQEKERLFNENRLLYAFLQCLPFVFNFYVLFRGASARKKNNVPSYQPNKWMMLLSLATAITVIFIARPHWLFVLGTFTVMTTYGAIRYWGEHMGEFNDKESNTHWFPLGMGIGNHDTHHHHPDYSWLTLTLGMYFRKKDTNPLKSIYGIMTKKNFHHYTVNQSGRRFKKTDLTKE